MSAPLFDRAPPFDPEAEIGVLGSVLLLPSTIEHVAHILAPEDFQDEAHSKIYRHLLVMREAGRAIDPMLLVDRLKSAGENESVGGAAYIGKILNAVPNAAHAVYYAEIVRDKAILRRLITAATDILRRAYDNPPDVSALVTDAEAELCAIGSHGISTDARLIADVARDTISELRRDVESPHRPGVMSGVGPLDSGMGPIMPGELAIVAARPGCGKTALAMQFAEQAAERSRSVLFVSLEMKDRELVRRELCRLAGLDSRDVRSLQVTEQDLERLQQASELFEGQRLWLWDKPNSNLGQIRNLAKQLNARERLDLVIVDYIGLIEPARHEQQIKRYELIGKFTRGLKNMAKEIDAPVIALCQLNREADGQRPRLSMLRESGNIEQDADTVIFVHHDDEASKGKAPHEARSAELIVAKHRHSAVGIVNVQWTPSQTRFSGPSEWEFGSTP
jgi:replicative DNA helicase